MNLSPEQLQNLQAILDGVADFYRQLCEGHQKLKQEQRNSMAVIAGVGYKTLFRLAYRKHMWGLWETTDKVTDRILDNPHREGDGRVPLISALLENVGATRYVKAIHGGMPNVPAVYEDVFHWLNQEPMTLATSPAGALSKHLGKASTASDAPHLDGTAVAGAAADDPGYWHLDEPDDASVAKLDAELVAERLPDFNRVRLL